MHHLLENVLSWTRYPVARRSRGPVLDEISLDALHTRLGRPVRVVVARFDGIGDWILCLPLVTALAADDRVGSVTLVGPGSHASLLDQESVTRYVRYTEGTILQPPAPGGTLGKIRAVTAETGRRAFRDGAGLDGDDAERTDLVVLPRWDTDLGQNARAWAAGTGAPITGFDPRPVPTTTWRERGEVRILSAPVTDADPAAYELERTGRMMHALGLGQEIPPGYGRAFFGVRREEEPDEGRPVVVLHTSSVEPKRRWPAESWARLIELIVSELGWAVHLIGAPAEHDQLAALAHGHEGAVRNLAGAPLSELPATLARAHAFVGNDSGPMHVACAVDIPVVGISPHPVGGDPAHRNAPERFGPRASHAEMLRPSHAISPCSDSCSALTPHCITLITPDDALAALRRVTATS